MKNCFLFFIFIYSCSFSKKTITEEKNTEATAELTLAQQKVPGITMEELTLGRKMYTRGCSGCHALKKPTDYTIEQWHPILAKMFVKSKISDSSTKKLITDYVMAKSK